MRGFRFGKLFGIDLRVDWSWVFIFFLLTWNLFAVFSQWHPDWPPGASFAIAGTAALLFFGCVLLHELAHALVALATGLKVRSITLFLFGGVSNLEQEPKSPGGEFLMAIVGPLTSIGLGVGLTALAWLSTAMSTTEFDGTWGAVSQLGPVATLLTWLGPINVLIGVFNLIPGFPLDGGRMLRSVLWKLTNDLRVATAWASGIGQGIGWLFVGCGIAMTFGAFIPLVGTGLVGGLWLAFIGWFLVGAASRATTRLTLDDALAGVTVEQVMQRSPTVVSPDLPVDALVQQYLVPGDDRALPVARDGRLVGLVSVSDVRRLAPSAWASTPVGAVMRGVETLSLTTPSEPLIAAFERLASRDIGQLPVVADGRLIGVLRRRDVSRWLELAWKPLPGGRAVPPRGAPVVSVDTTHTHPGAGAHPAM